MMRDLRSKEKLRASLGMTTERSIDLVPRRPVVARTSVPSHAGARQPRRARAPAAPAGRARSHTTTARRRRGPHMRVTRLAGGPEPPPPHRAVRQ